MSLGKKKMTLVYTGVNIRDLSWLLDSGLQTKHTTNSHELVRIGNDDVLFILYTSGKLVVQSLQAQEKEWKKRLAQRGFHLQDKQQETKTNPQETKQDIEMIKQAQELIGSDETLKGDTFGGLIVCGAYFKREEHEELKTLGVKDSKQILEEGNMRIAQDLLQRYPDRFSLQALTPAAYNRKLQEANLTATLNELHIAVGQELKERFGKHVFHVVDEYPGCAAGDVCVVRAESLFLVVAAASIVARYVALRQFVQLSSQAGFVLPRGSSEVQNALEKLKRSGKDARNFCKLHFSNVKKIFTDGS